MKSLRKSLRQKRRNISNVDRDKLALDLLSNIKSSVKFHKNQKIAIYLPIDGEVDPKDLQLHLKNQEINTYLPILVDKGLKFAKVGKDFINNKYNIPEPISTEIISAEQLDIIFMPLVGFDSNKNRLGMGGGYYDRTLAFRNDQKQDDKPTLIGIAFDCQQVDNLHPQDWDVPLDVIITPSGIY